MKNIIKKMHWILSTQFGFDPRRLGYSLLGLPRYIAGWLRFRQGYKGEINFHPCLFDWYEEGGATKNEYFLQDLHVARQIFLANPAKHVDIGSRIDGFVAHVASFREIEVFDIRLITSTIPGVVFRQKDLMNPGDSFIDYCDSISCLHAIEHFGLGRYGDPIDTNGSTIGLINMIKMLRPGGIFYLSAPVGRERVEFNAHRIFNPSSLVRLADVNGLKLIKFASIGSDRTLVLAADPILDITRFEKQSYALGIFTFVKL